MTNQPYIRHCEERSDKAISLFRVCNAKGPEKRVPPSPPPGADFGKESDVNTEMEAQPLEVEG
jgi:hypothetical protein